MSETQLKKQVIAYLKKHYPDFWFYKASDNFTAGIPDIIGCYRGRFVAIELKSEKGKVTKLQRYILNKIKNVGGITGVCKDRLDVFKLLEGCNA